MEFSRYNSGGSDVDVWYKDSSVDVRSGLFRLTADQDDDCGDGCDAENGRVHESNVDHQSQSSVPANANGAQYNQNNMCPSTKVQLVSTGPFNVAGGQTITVKKRVIPSDWVTIDSTKAPQVKIGTKTCTNPSVDSHVGKNTAAIEVTITCTTPMGLGQDHDVEVTIDGHTAK